MQLEVLDIQCSAALCAVFREKGILEFNKCVDRHKYPAVITNALKLFFRFLAAVTFVGKRSLS